MKNIYDQTYLAPVSVSNCGGVLRLILKITPPAPGYNLRTIGGCNRPLFWRLCPDFDRELSYRRFLL